MFRLHHRRRVHLLKYVYTLTNIPQLMDNWNIRTRIHDGRLFIIPRTVHYKFNLNPVLRACVKWNKLDVFIRNSEHARNFLTLLLNSITNPYEKIV